MWKNNDDDKKSAIKWFDRNIYIYIYIYIYIKKNIYIEREREKKSKDLVSDKEEIKSNNIIKRYKN